MKKNIALVTVLITSAIFACHARTEFPEIKRVKQPSGMLVKLRKDYMKRQKGQKKVDKPSPFTWSFKSTFNSQDFSEQ